MPLAPEYYPSFQYPKKAVVTDNPGTNSTTEIPFELLTVGGILTSAAAGTAITLYPQAKVGAGRSIYIAGFAITVNGATPWTDVTGTLVKLVDTDGTLILSVAKAQLTANASIESFGTGVTYGTALRSNNRKLVANKGLQFVADANFAAGSDIQVSVYGYVAP